MLYTFPSSHSYVVRFVLLLPMGCYIIFRFLLSFPSLFDSYGEEKAKRSVRGS